MTEGPQLIGRGLLWRGWVSFLSGIPEVLKEVKVRAERGKTFQIRQWAP